MTSHFNALTTEQQNAFHQTLCELGADQDKVSEQCCTADHVDGLVIGRDHGNCTLNDGDGSTPVTVHAAKSLVIDKDHPLLVDCKDDHPTTLVYGHVHIDKGGQIKTNGSLQIKAQSVSGDVMPLVILGTDGSTGDKGDAGKAVSLPDNPSTPGDIGTTGGNGKFADSFVFNVADYDGPIEISFQGGNGGDGGAGGAGGAGANGDHGWVNPADAELLNKANSEGLLNGSDGGTGGRGGNAADAPDILIIYTGPNPPKARYQGDQGYGKLVLPGAGGPGGKEGDGGLLQIKVNAGIIVVPVDMTSTPGNPGDQGKSGKTGNPPNLTIKHII
jgi:hypothetical protein